VTDSQVPRDIHLLTTEALLSDLISGQKIGLGDGKLLALDSDDARAILNWYQHNHSKWAGNLFAGDAEAMIDVINEPSPLTTPSVPQKIPSQRHTILKLARVVAHRFAGLHAYGSTNEPPNTFIFEPTKPITLFEGVNGSGKTSIANAIVWCLTGHLIRSQRPPEEGPMECICELQRSDGTTSRHSMSTITPMPQADSDFPAYNKSIPADSWVELTFVDADGNRLQPLRREQSRKVGGKLIESAPHLSSVGLAPISWRIATIMPALLPFLSVGSTSQLGHAVARLTGLSDLVDLAKHAGKASARIAKQIIKERQAELDEISERFAQAKTDLATAVKEYPAMALDHDTPSITDNTADSRLTDISTHFAAMKASALAAAKGVLGVDFDASNKAARDNLEASVRPAIQQLKQVAQLPSIARLSALVLDAEAIAETTALLNEMQSQAGALAQLAESPNRAQRMQLYARVSAWMHEHEYTDSSNCPVCTNPLDGTCDPVTGLPISDHLAEAARDHEIISRTVAEWSSHWVGRLLNELPKSLADEARRDLPRTPVALLHKALLDELFATEGFSGTLSALKADASALIDEQSALLPLFDEPQPLNLPSALEAQVATAALRTMLARIARAQAFADWRETYRLQIIEFIKAIRTGKDGTPNSERTLGHRLQALLAIVEGATPITAAITLVGRMTQARANYVTKLARIHACIRAANALDLLVPLGNLAQTQVDVLRKKLHRRSEYWRKSIYRNATEFAPDLTGTDVNTKGVLEFNVGREGATAPAQHISNASALRGALLGFFLAFREHVLATHGGIATLVLDDPQELLDNDNRGRLARGLVKLAAADAQIFTTSHDRKFSRSLVAEARPSDGIEHLSVHPVNAVRPKIVLSLALEELDRKRQAFKDNPDSATHAQDYASDMRIFLEARLGDLFDDLTYPAYAASTKAPPLFPLVDKLRSLVASNTGELFTNPIVKRFVDDPGLAEGAEAREVLNQSHHDKASISYMDVKSVERDFARLRTGIEKVHEQFRLYRWREPLSPTGQGDINPTPLPTITPPSFRVPIYPDIAAFLGRQPIGGSQDSPTEWLEEAWFEGKTLYYIRGDTLGFAIPSGAVAIVEAEPYPGRDQHLVIARFRGEVFARRLITSDRAIGVSLSTQMPDPRNNRPTMTFDPDKVKLHRIAGAIFTDIPPPAGGSEATLIKTVPELTHIAVAYRVREESAIPLGLPGQIILGGKELTPADLDACENGLVAVTLEDGSSIFKRVGTRLPGKLGHLRQFETIGGLGSSVVIAMEPIDGQQHIPTMTLARRVIGVLY
jgi:hypothetical protein